MDRRTLLGGALGGAGAVALSGWFWTQRDDSPDEGDVGRYGDLRDPDDNGLRLPEGFTGRVVARSGEVVPGTSYTWHDAPDGGACFPAEGGGWTYVSNSEVVPDGGVGALRFAGDGTVTAAYRVLSGSRANCSGGPTPWRTWLSCEEVDRGSVWETDPSGERPAVRHAAMGLFQHEAAAVDPDRRVVYLTEDEPDGCFYRFVPDRWPDLSSGALEVLTEDSTWEPVPDPSAGSTVTRRQVEGARRFSGGEGAWYADGSCWFSAKGDEKVWRYDAASGRVSVAYDQRKPKGPLTGADNLLGTAAQELFVAEDKGDMQVVVLNRKGRALPFAQVVGHEASEVTGLALSPDGTRLYFSSQRGSSGRNGGGVTYEVRGPFRGRQA